MTAINVTILPDRVDLFTDSAALGLDGRLRRVMSKVREITACRCVIAVRGEARALDAIATILPTVGRSFDALRAAAADGRLGKALGRVEAVKRGRIALLPPFDLVIAGLSTKGPRAFLFTNHGRMRGSGKRGSPTAWAPWDLPRAVIMPSVKLSAAQRKDPGANMLEIMGRQRTHREPSLFLPKGRQMVGGTFVEHTAVTRDGIQTRRFTGWDADRIGQPIGGGTAYRGAWLRMVLFTAGVSVLVWIAYVALIVGWLLARGMGG